MANCIRCGRQLPPLMFGKKICQWCVQHEAAQRGELGEDVKQPVMAAPWVRRESSITLTHVLFGANVAVFLAMALASGTVMDFPGQVIVRFGANFGPFTLSGQWWRLLTYMFLHGGLMHIAFNMWCLWNLGALCESLYGRWTYAAIYLITGFAGGLVSGLILGALIARAAPQHDKPLRRAGVLLFMVLIVGGSALGIHRWRGSGVHFGSAMDMQKNIDRMVGELQKKVRQSPQDASAHYALAHAYFSKGQFSEGETELKRVLELQPRNTRARMDMGAVYLRQDKPKEAQEEFTTVVAQEPDNAGAHAALGMALADQDNHEAAINEYKNALRLEPKARGVYYRMGVSQSQLKQYDEAIASYSKEREQNGDDAELESALAEAYQAKGMTQQAQEARTKAAQLENGQKD